MPERDGFSERVKRLLATRVGFRCSRPGCGRETSGPQENPEETINIGVAAHITAASPGGPRYDAALTPEQRASHENGIWLCQSCGKLLDNDEQRYTAGSLRSWKSVSEELARLRLEDPAAPDLAFREVEELMPALLDEMRADLESHPAYREFIIKRRAVHYNYGRDHPLLEYHYEVHPELDAYTHVLQNNGFIQDITYNNTKRFVMAEDFVRYLRRRRGSVTRGQESS